MKLDQMIESKYIKQSDVDGECIVTVKSIKKVNVARDDETPEYRWTVTFNEFPKPMVLNTTNIKRMGKALGNDTDEWAGGTVMLYVDPDIEFGGNVVGGLRIRAIPKHGTVRAAPRNEDDVNSKLNELADRDIPF